MAKNSHQILENRDYTICPETQIIRPFPTTM